MSNTKQARRNPAKAQNLGNVPGRDIVRARLENIQIKANALESKTKRDRDLPKKKKIILNNPKYN